MRLRKNGPAAEWRIVDCSEDDLAQVVVLDSSHNTSLMYTAENVDATVYAGDLTATGTKRTQTRTNYLAMHNGYAEPQTLSQPKEKQPSTFKFYHESVLKCHIIYLCLTVFFSIGRKTESSMLCAIHSRSP